MTSADRPAPRFSRCFYTTQHEPMSDVSRYRVPGLCPECPGSARRADPNRPRRAVRTWMATRSSEPSVGGCLRRGSLRATDSGHPLDASAGDGAPGQAHGNNLSLNGGLWHEVTVQWSAAPQLQDRTAGRRCPSRGPARRDEEVSGGRCVSASWWIPVLPSAGGSGGLLGGEPTEPGAPSTAGGRAPCRSARDPYPGVITMTGSAKP